MLLLLGAAAVLAACSVAVSFDGLVGTSSDAGGDSADSGSSSADAAPVGDAGGRFCSSVVDAALCVDFDDPDASPLDLGDVLIDRPAPSQGTSDDDDGPVGTLVVVADPDAPSGPHVLRATFDQFTARYFFNTLIRHSGPAVSGVELTFAMRLDSAVFPTNGSATTMQLAYIALRAHLPVNGDAPVGNALALLLTPQGELMFEKSNLVSSLGDLPSPSQPGLRTFFSVTMRVDLRAGPGTPAFSYALNGVPMDPGVDASVTDAGVEYAALYLALGIRDYAFAITPALVASYDNVILRTFP